MSAKSKMSRNKVPPPKITIPANYSKSEVAKTASGLDPEAEDRFEVELCWCIQQLEAGLADKNLQAKQIYNMRKSLNVLRSGNASLIKKRQVMRNTFGDYRAKMADDEKKFAKAAVAVKFADPVKKQETKSMFFKKARSSKNDKEAKAVDKEFQEKVKIAPDGQSEPFKFNFSSDKS